MDTPQSRTQLRKFVYWNISAKDKDIYTVTLNFIAALFSEICKVPPPNSHCVPTYSCYHIFSPCLSVSPAYPSGDLPADAGIVTTGLCQVLPSALPPRSPDWDHPYWPGGLLGETAPDTILWSALCYGNFSLAEHRTTSLQEWLDLSLHHCHWYPDFHFPLQSTHFYCSVCK